MRLRRVQIAPVALASRRWSVCHRDRLAMNLAAIAFVLATATAAGRSDAPAPARRFLRRPRRPHHEPPAIEQAQAEQALGPWYPRDARQGRESYVTDVSEILLSGQLRWHTFWQSAYSGGGFTLGAGYTRFVSPYSFVDVRGSITPSGYKRLEAQLASRLDCLAGAVRSRCWAAGARRRRSASTGSAWRPRSTTARTTASRNRTRRRCSRYFQRAPASSCAAASS